VGLELSADQVARHDAARASVDDDEIEHLPPREQGEPAPRGLLGERLVRPEKELLPGLATRVEGP
jgi:hypothetical protein